MRRIAVLCFLACIALLNGSAAQDFCQSEGTVSVEDMYLAPLFAPQKPTPAAPNTFGAANPFLINNDQSPYLPGAIVCDFAQSQCAIVGPRMKNNGIEIIGLNTPGLDGAGINAAGGLGIGGGALSADHTVVTAGSLGNGGGGLQSGLYMCVLVLKTQPHLVSH